MGVLDNIKDGISSIEAVISQNPLASVGVATATGAIVGATATSIIKSKAKKRKKKTKTTKKKSKKSKSKGRKLKFGSPAYRKKYLSKSKKRRKTARVKHNKRTSHKKIRLTKNGQPYVILANGRARFIKRSSASRSRKLKGGRY